MGLRPSSCFPADRRSTPCLPSETAHDEVVHVRLADGGVGAGAMTRGDMLLHVINHKTWHRGYGADMFYQASSRPPAIDLPVFLRDAQPAF